jgi:hypothetical protein
LFPTFLSMMTPPMVSSQQFMGYVSHSSFTFVVFVRFSVGLHPLRISTAASPRALITMTSRRT